LALGHAEEEAEEGMETLRMAFAFAFAAAVDDFDQLARGFGLTETKNG
jgi:hypothetical protein